MIVHKKELDMKEKLELTFYSYLIIKTSSFQKNFLHGDKVKVTNYFLKKKFVTISEFVSTSAPQKRNCSALLAILSPTFINEIRTGMPIPGAPLPPAAIANKKDDASFHGKCSNDFNLSSLSSLTSK